VNVSRVRFLGAGTALAAFGATLLTPFVAAAAIADEDDIKALNTLAAFEGAAIEAYKDGAGTGLLTPGVLTVAKGFLADHTAHRDALAAAIKAAGQTPGSDIAKIDYPELKTQADVLKFAEGLERNAASAYLGVIPTFKDRVLARLTASILGIETTHVTTLAAALKEQTAYKFFVA
jgi:hypothetical protein